MKEQDSQQSATANDEEHAEIKVVDRRRINLDERSNDDSSATAEAPSLKPAYVEELEARTRAAEQKVLDIQSRFEQLRSTLQRETDETRQRLNRAADERAQREKVEFIESLLPVLDNLWRAIKAAEEGSSVDSLLNGVRGIASSFENALLATGVEAVDSVGAKFDPQFHEAVDTIEVDEARDGFVTDEYSRGYRIGDRLVRPARVQVGRAAKAFTSRD